MQFIRSGMPAAQVGMITPSFSSLAEHALTRGLRDGKVITEPEPHPHGLEVLLHGLPEGLGPVADDADVDADEGVARGAGDGERVPLGRRNGGDIDERVLARPGESVIEPSQTKRPWIWKCTQWRGRLGLE